MRSKFLLLVYPLLLVGLLTAFWVETVVATIIDSRSQSSITPHPSILLTGFTATVAADHQIRLQWVSEYEGEFLGFNLYRYEKREKDSSIKLNDALISGYCDNKSAASYDFRDETAASGTEYYYILEALDAEKNSQYYGPVTVDTGRTGGEQLAEGERKTKLIGIYPSPFNPGTNIRFELKESSTIQIVIYNLLGQQITSIVQELDSGESTLYWDGRDNHGNICHSGIYFYHFLTGDGYEKYDKMILVT